MRVTPLVAAVVLAASAAVTPAAAAPAAPVGSPNPYLSWGTDATAADYAFWQQRMTGRSAGRKSTVDSSAPVVREGEAAGVTGANDTPGRAEKVPGRTARLRGHLTDASDVDVYQFTLKAGDVFAAQA